MSLDKHGLTIGIVRYNDDFYLSLKVVGKLTHEDYKKINPMIDSTLESVKDPKVKVFIDGSEFDGWELRAAWDDFKLGLKHGNEFDKIAFLGNKDWQKHMTKIAAWFLSGEMKYFENENKAIEWLKN